VSEIVSVLDRYWWTHGGHHFERIASMILGVLSKFTHARASVINAEDVGSSLVDRIREMMYRPVLVSEK
jgi:hypothetical protein